MAPWGPRAYFGAVAIQRGRGLLIFGGIVTPKAQGAKTLCPHPKLCLQDSSNSSLGGLERQYAPRLELENLLAKPKIMVVE